MDTTIGGRLKKIRSSTSQAAFADSLGVSASAVGQYERDEQLPGAAFLISIFNRYNVSIDWILTGQGLMHRVTEATDGAHIARSEKHEEIEAELKEERIERRELAKEFRVVSSENRQLWKENSQLRERLAKAEARAAPSDTPLNNAQTA